MKMIRQKFSKYTEGREVKKMKIEKILSILALLLLVPAITFAAVSLTVKATVGGGTALGSHLVLECTGYNYNPAGDPFTQCTNKGAATSLDFGSLGTRLLTSTGADNGGADCFYASKFFIVYLYPDAWGGKGYELTQTAATFPPQISSAVVMAPTYSTDDKYAGQTTGQGALITGETLGSAVLAKNGGMILKAKRPRIVRAEYGIPPKPGTGDTRPAGWTAIPLTTATGTYTSGTITISITEWQ